MAAALAAGSGGGAELQPGARALFVGRAYYGCAATVLDPSSDGFTRKVRIPAGIWFQATDLTRQQI